MQELADLEILLAAAIVALCLVYCDISHLPQLSEAHSQLFLILYNLKPPIFNSSAS